MTGFIRRRYLMIWLIPFIFVIFQVATPSQGASSGTVAAPARILPRISPSSHAPSPRMPVPGRLRAVATLRQNARSMEFAGQVRVFSERDLLSVDLPDGTSVHDVSGILTRPSPDRPDPGLIQDRLAQLLRLQASDTSDSAVPPPSTVLARSTPWSSDHLLADATGMNDEYVSLEISPLTGYIYAVFAATDLGGSDRDIHIARSNDSGATWQVWEMPAFPEDEYHPDLAIDAAGYLHTAWVRDDGTIVRCRSAGPDDPANWAWVRGLAVGEPCAMPAVAVSGAGQFATVFIAASWLTINWDYFQYEWTLIWMYSTNGGDTITYDYLVPDGYQDLWPDVALNGAMAYLVNGEQDPFSGSIQILLAADAISGDFMQPVNLTDWTEMSCGFPSLAATGQKVFCAYQLDFEDGLGNVDGDIVYSYSWDGLQTVYGPYGLVATTSESVGPAIYSQGNQVGCLWLEAVPNGDEFHLAARQSGLDGHPDSWQPQETVTDQHYVEPTFHSAAGVAGEMLHAAWIDRRDFPTQGLNVYTSERSTWPDLEPFTPEGWQQPLVASMIPGERANGLLAAADTFYVSFAVANKGLRDAETEFRCELTLDGEVVATWLLSEGLPSSSYVAVEDHPLLTDGGTHVLGLIIDSQNTVVESDEGDNAFSQEYFFITGDPHLVLIPAQISHQFPGPGKSFLELDQLLSSVPTERRVNVPVMDERLATALAFEPGGTQFRVVMEPATRVDPVALRQVLAPVTASLGSRACQDAVVGLLRQQCDRFQQELAEVTTPLVAGNLLQPPRALWLNGSLVAEAAPEAVEALAAHPAVGRLWLDDRLSQSFEQTRNQVSEPGTPSSPPGEWASPDAVAWHLTATGAEYAWAAGWTGAGVVLGHIDTGVAYDHPDLVGQLWDGGAEFPHHGWDYLTEDNDPYDGDAPYWHGSHTAGLLVGDGTSGTQTGVAPDAELMILRCVPGYYEDLVQGLQFCLDNGVNLISTSAGWFDPPSALRDANRDNAAVLLAAGIPWICAAGNGDNAGGHNPAPLDIVSPGDCPHPWYGSAGHTAVVTVGASTALDQVWPASGLGPTAWAAPSVHDDYPHPPGLMKPDLVAPGVDITSTFGPAGYQQYSGTSMATPLVAGAAALLLQASPDLTPSSLGELLESTAVDVGSLGRDVESGAGRLDIMAALVQIPSPDTESFWVHNTGLVPLQIDDIAPTVPWLTVLPGAAAVAPDDSIRCVVTFAQEGMALGSHHGEVTLASNDPDSPHSVAVTMIVGDVTDAGNPDVAFPTLPGLLLNHPNPFNPRTVLRFTLPVAGLVRLQIYDLQGRLVQTLVAEPLPAGTHELTWRGRDGAGQTVASGVYIARLTLPQGVTATRKLSLLK